MTLLDAKEAGSKHGGASFSIGNRIERVIWQTAWLLLARWTPPPLHAWRGFLLRLFGARIGKGARVHASVSVWLPRNLALGERALIGRRVNCYNQGHVAIGADAVVSQGAHVCASTHDVADPNFQLLLRPITIGKDAWIAADAFVGPGVTVGEGAVLGARGVAIRDLDAWTIYRGNPAEPVRRRVIRLA